MEDLTSPSSPESAQADVLVQTLQRQRSQVDTFLAAHRTRLLSAEANLAVRIDRIARELVQVRSRSGHVEGELSIRAEEIEQKARVVALLKEEFEAAQAAWRAAQDEASRQQRQLAEEVQRQQEAIQTRLGELTARHAELAEAEAKLRQEQESLALARERNEEESRRLEAERGGAVAQREANADLQESRRRYEMAVEDVRELRAENEDLKERLAESRVAGASAKGIAPESLDWESQKRRLLEALEAGFDENDDESAGERLKIEQVIETTNRIIAEKDREIGELHALLREQSGQVGAVAVGAEAFAEAIDKDAVVREERENLKRLQAEVREKLRKAEIDISIERAKIARERMEVEEKLRALGEQDAAKASRDAGQPPPEKPARGRWLSRLGLKDVDESDA